MRLCKVNDKDDFGNVFFVICCPKNSRKVSEKFTRLSNTLIINQLQKAFLLRLFARFCGTLRALS